MSVLSPLLHRRVPQIVGLYIAAMWMAVEIGDWVTDRFGLEAALTSYLFLGMAILLPSVALLAWGHGAPGRDRWTRTEKFVVPLNVVAAAVALSLFQPGREASAAVETMTMMDEQGVKQTYAVAAEGKVERLYVAFLDNETGDDSLDWLAAGIPWLLDADFDRNIFVNVLSPFSASVAGRLRQDGFSRGAGVPLSLSLELADERNAAVAAVGSYSRTGDQFRIDLRLYQPDTGGLADSISVTGTDLLALADELTEGIAAKLSLPTLPRRLRAALPIRESVSSSLPAIRATVEAALAQRYDNDYATALAKLQEAINLDSSFALALADYAVFLHLIGEGAKAGEALDRALDQRHRLSEDMQFLLKAVRYENQGDFGKMRKVLRLWTEVSPENAEAWRMFATITKIQGGAYEEALAALETAYELDPARATLKEIAQVEVVLGRNEDARRRLQRYLEQEPTDSAAMAQLANLSALEGDFESAREQLERASLIGPSRAQFELAQIDLDIRQGDFAGARERLAELQSRTIGPVEALIAVNRNVALSSLNGRFTDAIDTLEAAVDDLRAQMPPVQVAITLGFSRAQMLAMLGRTDEALAAGHAIREDLQGPLSNLATLVDLMVYAVVRKEEELADAVERSTQLASEMQLQPTMVALIDGAHATLMELRGEYDEAVSLNRDAVAKFRQFAVLTGEASAVAQIETDLAHSLVLAGEVEEARVLLDGIFAYYPSYSPALLELAYLQHRSGDTPAAKATLRALLRTWSDADPEYVKYRRAIQFAEELDLALAEAA